MSWTKIDYWIVSPPPLSPEIRRVKLKNCDEKWFQFKEEEEVVEEEVGEEEVEQE